MPHETNGTTPKLSREADSLSPWVPSPEEPWDREAACHLLRRCGFGATKERVDRALEEGVEATVESLLSPSGDARSRTAEALLARGERLVRRRNTPLMGSWWLQWMSQTSDPLRERLTLAWHDLFAVSDAKVNSARLMFDQNKALRTHALGNLRTLAREGITRSAAMLRFLDADSNRKGQPNENLARELFELFLLGIGNYTEIDIREGARALTGLRAHREEAQFQKRWHDAEPKTIFGKRGSFDPDGLVDLCFDQPACARHFARTLLHTFVNPEPSSAAIENVAASLREHDYELTPVLRQLFLSQLFFAPQHRRSIIKSPVQWVVGALRDLGMTADADRLMATCTSQGQRLFVPPGVQGWPGGRDWMTSGRWIARQRFAEALAHEGAGEGAGLQLRRVDSESGTRVVGEPVLGKPAQLIAHMIPGLDRAQRVISDVPSAAQQLLLTLTLPEYQLV